jgi:hypothetical protein
MRERWWKRALLVLAAGGAMGFVGGCPTTTIQRILVGVAV